MTLFKRVALAICLMFGLAAFGTASASATTDTASIVIDGGTACDVEFDYDDSIPGNETLTNLDNPNGCTFDGLSIDISNTQSNLVADFSGTSSSGTASLSGVLGVGVGGPFFGCKFDTAASGGSGPLTGTYAASGSVHNFSLDGALVKKSGSFGFFGCPGSVGDLVDVEIDGTINP